MKTTNATAAKIIPVVADSNAWKFTATSASLDGHTFDATYSVARTGDVYVFAKIGDMPCRIHVGKGMPMYHECFDAAMAARQPAKQAEVKAVEPAKPVEAKPAAQPKAEKPVKAKAAQPAKQAKPAAEPAKPVAVPADNAWIGTTLEGKGWRIAFDEAAQRTRVIFDRTPSAKQKAAIDAAGFYWSNTTKSWNKKLTRKAYRAAATLAEALNALK